MAKAKKTAKTDVTGRPLQWDDMTREGQRVVSSQMKSAGTRVPEMVASARDRADTRVNNTTPGTTAHKNARKERQTLDDITPHLVAKPVTIASAAKGREDQYNAATERNKDQSTPDGAGWYFNHHADIAAGAKAHGYDTHTAIVASAVMSPRNAPDNEKAALHGMMQSLREGTVHMTPQMASHFHDSGVPVDANHIGQIVPIGQLHRHAVAALSDTKVADHIDTNVPEAIAGLRKGGSKEQIKRAADVLTGHTPAEHAIDPHSAPKVASYAKNIADAVPNTPEHVEYMTRVQRHHMVNSGQMHPGQTGLDLFGLGHSTEGMLSPTRSTAEDTWQNTMTFGQKNELVGDKGVTHVGKTVGGMQGLYPAVSKTQVTDIPKLDKKGNHRTNPKGEKMYEVASAHPDADIKGAALHHAFNNKATQVAAANLSVGHEHPLPVVAAQEIPWTEVRRSAGKDPEYRKQQRSEAPEVHAEIPGQQALFGNNTPMPRASRSIPAAPAPVSRGQFGHLAGHENELTERDHRAANAMTDNTMAKRSRQRREARAPQEAADFAHTLTQMKQHPVHGFISPGHPKFHETI